MPTGLNAESRREPLRAPLSIYEIHIGSWKKKSAFEGFSYRELADPLVEYVKKMGFTHVEFLPVAEHAFYPSWGYQVTGFYAPTSRFGTPDDFQYLVNRLHEAGIGIIVDWVPAHFPRDEWALANFDGTALYEHQDPRKARIRIGERSFLITAARSPQFSHRERPLLVRTLSYRWPACGCGRLNALSRLFAERRRMDPQSFGGRENLEAVEFLRSFNHFVHTQCPGVMTIAEESRRGRRSRVPPYLGGLGFSFKWNMGWMHDTLNYFKRDPV